MTRLLVIAALFMLSGCGGTPAAAPPVSYPATASTAWKMLPGTWAEYNRQDGSGVEDPATHQIAPTNLSETGTFRITNLSTMHNGYPAIARVFSNSGVTTTTIPLDLTNVLIQQADATGQYIGEVANFGDTDILQGEPVATINPVAGESFKVVSTVHEASGLVLLFPTSYSTTAIDSAGIHTTLIETPSNTVYNYIFDGELQSVIFGQALPDSSVPALTIYTRTSTGSNP